MQKILIANQNVEQNSQFCQYLLSNDKRFEVIGATDGITTLNKYHEIKPDVLVLGSYFVDMNCIEIIDRLSSTIEEKKNCNTILTANSKDKKLLLTNIAKVYKIIYDSFNFKDIFNTICELCSYNQYEQLNEFDVDLLLLRLKINLNSIGSDYIREAIIQCYYYPYLLKSLDDVFSLLSIKYAKTTDAIRSSFRTALEYLNTHRNMIEHPIIKYFMTDNNITPKMFLEIVVLYLHIQKNKR